MFTGLVESIGRLTHVHQDGGALRVSLDHDLPGAPLARGESVAIDGCCLTAIEPQERVFTADLSPETIARTGGASSWFVGRKVNLERALAVGSRMGGHFVQGHVDGRLRVLGLDRAEEGWATLSVAVAPEGSRYLVEKGSVALSGVSLTVARLLDERFEVALIPETLAATTLGEVAPGDELNVEYDVLAKYVERALGRR